MSTDAKPNVLWIMSDDLSWGDLGCFGVRLISTPTLDRLAAEGMTFSHCHSGNTVCAPSRSSLMQGLHQGHATVRDNMRAFSDTERYRASLLPGDTTVAQLFKDVGYATGLFGKWGLALHGQSGHPNDVGFDEFFGYLNQRKAHSYYPPYLWHNKTRVDLPGNVGHEHRKPNGYDADGKITPNGIGDPAKAEYSFDLYHQKSLEFIREHAGEPLFLYLAYTIPHGVQEVPELGKYKDQPWEDSQKAYAAMVTRMDSAIGELLDQMKAQGDLKDTLVFFVSDNGYSFLRGDGAAPLNDVFDHRGPWKGGKGHLHQGGLRVPALAWWAGKIEAGSCSDHEWTFYDFLPTVADLLGVDVPSRCDGLSILPTLLGNGEQKQHEYMYWEYQDEQAVRIDGYWAHREKPSEPVRLYDATNDPEELNDLARERPELAERIAAIMTKEHEPALQSPSPGESKADWAARAAAAGLTLVHNVDT